MPIKTLNDLKKGSGITISGSVSSDDMSTVEDRMRNLVGQRLAGARIVDAHVQRRSIVSINLSTSRWPTDLTRNMSPYDHSVAKITMYRSLQSFLLPPGESRDARIPRIAPRVDMGASMLHLCPDATGVVPPPDVESAFAKDRESICLTIAPSHSLKGKRITLKSEDGSVEEDCCDLHFSSLIFEVCPQDANGAWLVNNTNGIAYSLACELPFSQQTSTIRDLRLSLDGTVPRSILLDESAKQEEGSVSLQSLDFHTIVFRVSWGLSASPYETPPTDDNICAVCDNDHTVRYINIHEALFDPDAVANGGGRLFKASMEEFNRLSESASDHAEPDRAGRDGPSASSAPPEQKDRAVECADKDDDRAQKRQRMLEAAQRRGHA